MKAARTYRTKRTKRNEVKWRGSSHARGYGSDWQKLRKWHLSQHPLCVTCLRQNRTTVACDVDHIRPFQGKRDPLRMDPANLQSLCRSCHNAKTKAQNG